MTVPTSASSTTIYGNGSNTSFVFNFIAVSASDISVIYTDASENQTTLLSSQYSISLNSPSPGALWGIGGVVSYPLSGSPISSGTSLTITRTVPLTQETSISNQGNFDPSVIESALDTLEFQIQQVAARGGAYRATWATNTSYNFGDIVQDGVNGADTNSYYICASSNTSGIWSTDLANGLWVLAIASVIPAATLPLAIANGGTGATSSATALTNLGGIALSANNTFTGTGNQFPNLGIGGISGFYALSVVQAGSSQTYFGSTGSNPCVITFDCATAGQNVNINYSDAGVTKWSFGKSGINDFRLGDVAGSKNFLIATSGGTLNLGPAQNFTIDQSGNVVVGGTMNGASGACMVLLATQTASSSSAITFTGYLTSTYTEYLLVMASVVPSANGVLIGLQVGESGTIKTAGNYEWHYNYANSNNTGGSSGSTTGTNIVLGTAVSSSATNGGINGEIRIYNPSSTAGYKALSLATDYYDTTGAGYVSYRGGGHWTGDAGAITDLKILPASGTLVSGLFYLFGIRKS